MNCKPFFIKNFLIFFFSDYSNQNYQYTNVSKLRHQGQNKYYNKNYWNFHGHDDQITSYKNHEDDLNENDHAM